MKNENFSHKFDFAIFNKNKLRCLVEIDGDFYHSLVSDCDGYCSKGDKDYLRYKLVPDKVKYLVIDSSKVNDGIKELKRILPMKYKDWKKEMLRSIPKNIEDAIPKFSKKRMLYDWKRLKTCKYNRYANIGKSILITFCRSHFEGLNWKFIRKSLYKSPVSSHHLLEGLDNFTNVSRLRHKFYIKYKEDDIVLFKKHSPEKMLAVCSLGKTYACEEPIDKESLKIVKFLNLSVCEIIK